MVRELGDGEPSDLGLVSERSRNDSVRSSRAMSVDDKEGRGRNKSKSPGTNVIKLFTAVIYEFSK